MNILIRADASSYIGYGHVMRCFTLAEELNKHAANVDFICKTEAGNLINFIRKNGFNVHELPAMLDSAKDSEYIGNLIVNRIERPDYIVVDHYNLSLPWEEYLLPYTDKMMVIDDFVNRRHKCDILLNQNYGFRAQEYEDLTPGGCKRLTGPLYALLRDQFKEMRKAISKRSDEVKRILIFFGGADTSNETKKAIEAVTLLNNPAVSCTVIVGDSNLRWKEIEALCKSLPNFTFYRQVYDIAPLMINSDLAIGAGGSNTWERCCLGLPSIVIIQAENQRRVAESLEHDGIIVNAGWFERVTPSILMKIIMKLIDDKKKLSDMRTKAMETVDGEGAGRVVAEMFR